MSKKMNAKTEKRLAALISPDRTGTIGQDTCGIKYDKATERYSMTKNGEFLFSGYFAMCVGKAEAMGVKWESVVDATPVNEQAIVQAE